MKKKYFIILTIIIIIIFGIFIFSNLLSNFKIKEKNVDEKKYSELNIVSEYNEYVVVLNNSSSEMDTFEVFKNTERDLYKKVFSLPEEFNLEKRFICWNDNKLYIIKDGARAYDLSTGKRIYTGDLNKIMNNTTGRIDNVLGSDENFIYYTYTYKADHFYGKISYNLKDVIMVQEDDIPKEFKY